MNLYYCLPVIKIVLIIWRFFLYTTDSLLLFNSVPARNPSAKKKVLIIRLDVIGDFILWLDSAKEYKKLYPEENYQLTLLGNMVWKDIADNLPFFDTFIFFERKKFLRNPFYRYRLLKQIFNTGFDIVIQPRYSREFIIEDAFVRTCKAPERIGIYSNHSKSNKVLKRFSNRWYTTLIRKPEENLPELKRNENFVQILGAKNFKAGIPKLLINKNVLNTFENLPNNYYILSPGAGDRWREWPAQNFSQLADKIYNYCGLTGIICGSLSDRTVSHRIISQSSSKLLDFAGLTSLSELIAIINQARFIVTNESAAIHIAASVDTPSVCVLGGGHYGRFMPYDNSISHTGHLPISVIYKMDCFMCNWKNKSCTRKNTVAPCVEKISIDSVWNKTQNIIETYKQK